MSVLDIDNNIHKVDVKIKFQEMREKKINELVDRIIKHKKKAKITDQIYLNVQICHYDTDNGIVCRKTDTQTINFGNCKYKPDMIELLKHNLGWNEVPNTFFKPSRGPLWSEWSEHYYNRH